MSHLTIANHVDIERGLNERQSFGEIARHLGVSRSTVLREILRRRQESDKGARGRIPNRCIHRSECDRHFLCEVCTRPLQLRRCSTCARCNGVCPDFEEIVCGRLQKPRRPQNGILARASLRQKSLPVPPWLIARHLAQTLHTYFR